MAEFRLNFDNRGLQTGLDAGEVAADFERQLIVDRRALFETALDEPEGFGAGVLARLKAYNDAAQKAQIDALRRLTLITQANLKTTYSKKRGGDGRRRPEA